MTAPRRSGATRWSTLEPRLKRLTDGELRELVRDLFDLSEANRTYLNARLLSDSERERSVAQLRRDLERAAPAAGEGRGSEIRRLLRAYVRATADHDGAALLLARHLRTLLKSMRDSGAHRPGGGFVALVGELGRLVDACGPAAAGELADELDALLAEASRTDSDLTDWLTERIRPDR